MQQRPTPPRPAALAAIAARADAGELACPYCQDALQARWTAADALQLCCRTCGFSERPESAGSAGVRPSPAR